MKITRVSAVVAVLAMGILCAAAPARAATEVELGRTTAGGLMIYYNNLDVSGANGVPDGVVSGYDENGSNQAYMRMQFGYNNDQGAGFQFSDADLGGFSWNGVFSGAPVGSSQFGFDLQATLPAYDGSGGVAIPSVDFADNVDNTPAGADMTNVIPGQGQVAWAINDYKSPSGPESGSLTNSLFRGTEFTLNVTDFVMNGSQYTMTVEGTLVTDGLFHWYNPNTGSNGDGTSNMSSWLLSDTFLFRGTLVYDMNYAAMGWDEGWNTYSNGMENGHDQRDFYVGEMTLYAQVVPLPAAAWAGFALMGALGGVAGIKRKLRRQ